jgi:hypothetical protein
MSRRKREYHQRYIRHRGQPVTRIRVDVDALMDAVEKFGHCSHGRMGGFACPHCNGIGLPGQVSDKPIAVIHPKQQRITWLDENGEPMGTSPFTRGSSKITTCRIQCLDGKIVEW